MNESLLNRILKDHKRRTRSLALILCLSMIVSLGTFAGFHKNAIAKVYTREVLDCPYAHEGAEPVAHVHNDDCYEGETLVCTLPEREAHTHDDTCYAESRMLSCGLEESEGHQHTGECFDEDGALTCGMEAGEGAHVHSDACFENEYALICDQAELPIHVHEAGCFRTEEITVDEPEEVIEPETPAQPEQTIPEMPVSDPNADLETAEDWNREFENFELSGNWARDLVLVAATQQGRGESPNNFEAVLNDAGDAWVKHGYTRYGAWYGVPYANEWSAMFVSFCLRYAGIPAENVPNNPTAAFMAESFSLGELFAGRDYVPAAGDLIFFGTVDDDIVTIDHMGIVYHVDPENGTINTVEGDRTDAVATFGYYLNDEQIVGYGILPQNPNYIPNEEENTDIPDEEFDGFIFMTTDEEEETPATEEATAPAVPMPAQSWERTAGGIKVTVDAPEGAFPENTRIAVTPVNGSSLMDTVSDAVDGAVLEVQAVDITFFDAEGREIEPAVPIRVVMTPAATEHAEEKTSVVHVDIAQQTAELIEQAEGTETDNSEVVFDAEAFTIYAIVYTYQVEYEYEVDGKTFTSSMPGAENMTLTQIVEGLGIVDEAEIETFVSKIVSIASSNEEVAVVNENNEIRVLKDGEAKIVITMQDGAKFHIDVRAEGETSASNETATVSTKGDLYLPADAELKAEVLDEAKSESAIAAVEAQEGTADSNAAAAETAYQVFDISLENVEADQYNGFQVEVKLPEGVVGKNFHLYHVHDGKVDELKLDNAAPDGETVLLESVSFVTPSFSHFVLSYTVDFHWEVDGKTFDFSIPGGGFVSFHKLVEVLSIPYTTDNEENQAENASNNDENDAILSENSDDESVNLAEEVPGINNQDTTALTLDEVIVSDAARKFVADVEKVEFSSPALMDVSKVDGQTTVGQIKESRGLEVQYSAELTEEQIEDINSTVVESGDWALISILPFESTESLTVTMKTGEVFEIRVTDAQLKKTVIDAKGDTWEITVTYDDSAEIPEGADLKVEEILPEDERYEQYYQQSLEKIGVVTVPETIEEEATSEVTYEVAETSSEEDAATTGYAHIFDIQIWAGDQQIEPVSGSAVSVNIKLLDAPDTKDTNLQVVHFGKGGLEVMELIGDEEETRAGETELNFVTDEFSVYSVVEVTSGNMSEMLNDGSYALVTGIALDPGVTGYSETYDGVQMTDYFTIIVNAQAMMGKDGVIAIPETDQNTSWVEKTKGLGAEGVHAWTDSDGNNFVGGGATQWQFESAGNDRYRIFTNDNGYRQYITHNNAEVSLTNNWRNATAFSVTLNTDGTILIHDGNMYLHNNAANAATSNPPNVSWSAWVNHNYILTTNNSAPTGNEYKFRLCKESDGFEPQAAQKVAASTITTNVNYVIYRKFEDAQGKEALYALAHDGTFVRVYDGGDTIYWRETDKNIYWNYQTNASGYPVLLTLDPNTNETIYLNPNHSTGQTMANSTTGITLLGKDNGEYSTAIECWDQTAYDYAGLHVTVDSNGNATLSTGTRVAETSDEFLFAVASEYPGATAEIVDTVDSDSLGIKITMFDYGDWDGNYDAGDKLDDMTDIAGSAEYTPHAAHALVKPYLESGLPSGSAGAMTGLFSSGGAIKSSKSDVNHLFLQSYYDESGTFRYRSEDNYAYLQFENGVITGTDFTVYRQAATPYTTDAQPGHTYYHHGHFMPYNDIDMNNNLSRLMNQYGNEYTNGTAVGEIPLEDGRTYEDIYGIQGIPNYYTGMKMEAKFIQPNDGKLENGEDMIFKFTGDDDMWVYIDGILVLDIGGIHEPLSGTINFATGVVTNPAGSSLPGTTTLRAIFEAALNDSSTPEDVKAKIREIQWDGDTFADYTNHSFSAFYMERGAGASNLDIQFNLKVTLTDEFTVEKELPEGIDTRFVNEQYKFRATYMDGTEEKPLYAGITDVCSAVVYKDKTDDNGNPVSVPVDTDGYFYLKPGEVAVFKMADESIRYNVKEVEIDSTLNEKVEVNGTETTVTDGTAEAGYAYVGSRSQVLFLNHPYTQNLLITKHITEDSAPKESGEDPRFEFRVYLETTVENEDGTTEQKLVPYSYGPYYLIKEVNGVTHYFTLTGTNNAPEDKGTDPVVCSTTGRSGSINSIPPEYTVVIPNLIVGTNFYVEERRDNIPTGYSFVHQELKVGTYDTTDLTNIDRILARDETDHQEFDQNMVGRIKKGVDAESHIYNRKLAQETDITVEKQWTGNMPAGSSTIVLYKVVGEGGEPSQNITVTFNATLDHTTSSSGFITVTASNGQTLTLSNANSWTGSLSLPRGTTYSFTYSVDGTKVTSVTPTSTEGISDSTTINLSAAAVEVKNYSYHFYVPENSRPAKGSVDVTFNGNTVTLSGSNNWEQTWTISEEDSAPTWSVSPTNGLISSPVSYTDTENSGNHEITITPAQADLTMQVPVSVTWDQSATTLPDDASVTFTFIGNGETKTLTLPASGSWSSSIDLDRLDDNGNLITYSVAATASTSNNKKLTLSGVPTSISDSGSIAASGVVKSGVITNVTINKVNYWNTGFEQYNGPYDTETIECEPGSIIVVTIEKNPNYSGTPYYRTSDGQQVNITSNTFEVTIPQGVTTYTINIHDEWGGSAISSVSVAEKITTTASTASARTMLKASGLRAVPTHVASTTKTFYDVAVGGTGDQPFTTILYKDLPAGAVEVETITLTGNASKNWANLPTLDENGNRIYYYIVEKDATAQADEMTVTYQYSYRDDGTIEKVTIINNVEGTEEPDTKSFTFTKIWRDPMGTANLTWPDGKEITVTVEHNNTEYAQYTIKASDLTVGNTIAANNDSTKISLTVLTVNETGYVFQLTGLPWGDGDTEYTYTVSETTVEDYQSPKYFGANGTQAMGAKQIGDNGTIYNDQIGYTLPSTGGPGTRPFTILGSILIGLAGASLLPMRRRRRA